MRVKATVNPSKSNRMKEDGVPTLGLTPGTSRIVQVDFDFGQGFDGTNEGAKAALADALDKYGTKAVFSNWIRGAKLGIQSALRSRGDIQIAEDESESWLTDAEITDYMETEFKLPEEVQEPKSEEEKGLEYFANMTPEVRAKLLSHYAAQTQQQ